MVGVGGGICGADQAKFAGEFGGGDVAEFERDGVGVGVGEGGGDFDDREAIAVGGAKGAGEVFGHAGLQQIDDFVAGRNKNGVAAAALAAIDGEAGGIDDAHGVGVVGDFEVGIGGVFVGGGGLDDGGGAGEGGEEGVDGCAGGEAGDGGDCVTIALKYGDEGEIGGIGVGGVDALEEDGAIKQVDGYAMVDGRCGKWARRQRRRPGPQRAERGCGWWARKARAEAPTAGDDWHRRRGEVARVGRRRP